VLSGRAREKERECVCVLHRCANRSGGVLIMCEASAASRLHPQPPLPSTDPPQQGEGPLASLLDCLTISEFLAAFGPALGAPVLDVRRLCEAAAWPCDGEGELVAIYTCLLRFLLAQWVSAEGAPRLRS